MINKFKHYHKFSNEELESLSANCIFVFDSNSLLNMYRYSRPTVEEFLKILNRLKQEGRIWIPYQVGFEFHENRLNVISEQYKSYDDILKTISNFKTEFSAKYKNHQFLNIKELLDELNQKSFVELENKINLAKSKQPNWAENDEILIQINQLFDSNIGDTFPEKKILEIKSEGKLRYENKIPPGFQDDKKPDDRKFGDLIIWFEIIEKAKVTKKNIIFVSGDTKEDWWLQKEGKKIMPLPSLKKEMYEKAGVEFHIYTPDTFLEYLSSKNNQIDLSISEVRKFQEIEELIDQDKRYYNKVQIKALNLSNPFNDEKLKLIIIDLEKMILKISDILTPFDPVNEFQPYSLISKN